MLDVWTYMIDMGCSNVIDLLYFSHLISISIHALLFFGVLIRVPKCLMAVDVS